MINMFHTLTKQKDRRKSYVVESNVLFQMKALRSSSETHWSEMNKLWKKVLAQLKAGAY